MQLIKALRYSEPSSLAFVGAGGKTTALFRAARELSTTSSNERSLNTILVTTTTHLGTWQSTRADHLIIVNSLSEIANLERRLPRGVVLLTGFEKNNLLDGLTPKLIERIRVLAEHHNLPLLIEADGAHTRPLKAPAEYEPAIPDFVKHVVVIAGLQGLGKPLTEEFVHRPEKFGEYSGLHPGEEITDNALVKVLLHKNGGLKNIPSGARRIVLLNQADTSRLQSKGKDISEQLVPTYNSSVIASLSGEKVGFPIITNHTLDLQKGIHAVIEQIGGVILAAGGSSRFGEPKQLLLWKGQPFIRHVAVAALNAGLSPIVVVIGCSAAEVLSAIKDLPLRIVINDDWASGLSSSIKIGISSLPKEVGAAVFLQSDQPQIPPSLIMSLIEAHQTTLNPIIAPQIDGQRGNPVLFDSRTFSQLLSLEGDIGGRVLFSQFSVQWVIWHDRNILLDIDTPEDYHKFLVLYPCDEAPV